MRLENTVLIEQDYVRRIVLKEKDRKGASNIELIRLMTEHGLKQNKHVLMEGILDSRRYGDMLNTLMRKHDSYPFYFDISLEETFRRHKTKEKAKEFGEKELRKWFNAKDFLNVKSEVVIPESYSLSKTVGRILRETGI